MQRIEHLLRRTMGLDAASIGSSLISQTVRSRMQNCGLTKLEDYTRFLRETPAELSALVEAVVVKETWFFRDEEPFTVLVRLVWSEWLPNNPVGPLRLLSVPCSTGEEPYSMAMALLDAGLPADRFQLEAVDISAHALDVAQGALYRKNSFRGPARDYRERHFQPFEDGYLLNQNVRGQVRFQKGNILDGDCLDGSGIYDYIFCRNLLIYFDRPTQEKVLQKLERLLKSSGVLFVGPVELPLVARQGLASARIPMAAACRKVEAPSAECKVRKSEVGSQKSEVRSRKRAARSPKSVRPLPAQTPRAPLRIPHSQSPLGDELENAARLADEGRLAEAVQLCKKHIQVHGATAQAYYLLGLVRDAEGNETLAVEFYRKALYLEPNHYDTLVQMATLSEKKGDANGARLLHKRAQRVLEKT